MRVFKLCWLWDGQVVRGAVQVDRPTEVCAFPFLGGDDMGRLLASLQQPSPGLHLPMGQGVGRRGSH